MQLNALVKMVDGANWHKKRVFGLLFAGYTGLIYYFSSLPGQSGPPSFAHVDKVEHVIVYGFMAGAVWVLLRQWPVFKRCWLWTWIYSVGHGAFSEWHQLFVPGRYADVLDLVADAVGATLSIWLLETLRTRRAKQEKKIISVQPMPDPEHPLVLTSQPA